MLPGIHVIWNQFRDVISLCVYTCLISGIVNPQIFFNTYWILGTSVYIGKRLVNKIGE